MTAQPLSPTASQRATDCTEASTEMTEKSLQKNWFELGKLFYRAANSPIDGKSFSLYFGLILGIGLSVVAALNFAIDPLAQYGTGLLPPIVQTSRENKVQGLPAYASNSTQPVEGLILGSSRVLKIEPDYLQERTGHKFYNAGVNHGKPEDMLAMVRYFETVQHQYPKIAIIGVDVIAFQDLLPIDARLLANRSLRGLIPEAINWSQRLSPLADLFSFQQTKSSVKSVIHHFRVGDAPVLESLTDDGTIDYHSRESRIEAGTYDFESALEYNRREFQEFFIGYDKLSQQRLNLLKLAVKKLADNQCRVYLFITPEHPALLDTLRKKTTYQDRHNELANELSAFASASEVHFQDLALIDSFGGDPNQFVDGIHPLEFNTRLMIDQLIPLRKEEGADAL